jgi:hypothetical protein
MNKNDVLSRKVVLHVMRDGILTLNPVRHIEGHTGDWRDVAIDMLIDADSREDLDNAAGTIVEMRDEPLTDQREDVYTLPIFSVDTVDEANTLRVRMCRMMIGEHPLLPQGERVYQLSMWNQDADSLEELWRVQAMMVEVYRQIKSSRAKNAMGSSGVSPPKRSKRGSSSGRRRSKASNPR